MIDENNLPTIAAPAGEDSALTGALSLHAATARRSWAVPAVADGLMLLIGGLAAVLRLGELARLPLSPAEATAALPSWQFWTANPVTAAPLSPAYFTFTNLVMALGVGGDTAARLMPALFGLLTVLLPWLARGKVRPAAYLTAALFLAVSPILVAVSRTAGGDAFALFALLALALAWLRWDDGRAWPLLAGAALGLGLASSPLFYTGLIPLVVAATLTGGAGRLGQRAARTAALSAAVVFVAAATCALLYLPGLGAALRLAFHWVQQFGLAAGQPGLAAGLASPFLALLRYDPAATLGLVALVWRRGERFGLFVGLWAALILPLMLLQAGEMVNVAALLLPAYLLTGLLAGEVWARREPRASRRTAVGAALLILALGALLVVAGGRIARLGLLAGEYGPLMTVAALAFALAGVAVIVSMAWDNAAARRGVLAGIALLLLFWQWGAAMQLSRQGANDPRERWVAAGTDDDVPVMMELLRRTSLQVTSSERDLTIFSLVDSPVLRWYLRDYLQASFGATLPHDWDAGLSAAADVVIAPLDAQPELPADYFGADFGLERHEVAPGPLVLAEALKWWLFRESTAPANEERVVLWIRSDLVAPQ